MLGSLHSSSGPPATPQSTSSGHQSATPYNSTSGPLSSFLTFPIASASGKPKKTGKARVLTSNEYLPIMKEKERIKQEEAESKEKPRLENLERRH